jgi:hypothetical protein
MRMVIVFLVKFVDNVLLSADLVITCCFQKSCILLSPCKSFLIFNESTKDAHKANAIKYIPVIYKVPMKALLMDHRTL